METDGRRGGGSCVLHHTFARCAAASKLMASSIILAMRTIFRVVPALLVLGGAPLGAQSAGDAAAYAVLLATPPGALPPMLSSPMLYRAQPAPRIGVRYGHISFSGFGANTFAGDVNFAAGNRTVIGVTAGYETYSCSRCDGHFIASGRAEGRLTSTSIGTGSDASLLTIGLNGEMGFAKPTDATGLSITAGLPVALVAGGPTVKIAPFVTPGFGWARASGSATTNSSGSRLMLGGGIAVQSVRSSLGANVGFQKVFIENGETMFGVNVTFALK